MPPAAGPPHKQRRSERTRSADSHSSNLSPRDRSQFEQGPQPSQAHTAAGPEDCAHEGLGDHATDMQSQAPHEATAADASQPVIGLKTGSSTPDLSPRGDFEADDPPTPRMYKSIVPTAAPSHISRHHPAHHHSESLGPGSKADGGQMVLHLGHYDQAQGGSSPRRHPPAHHAASQQASEDVQHLIRYAADPLWHSTLHWSHCRRPWPAHSWKHSPGYYSPCHLQQSAIHFGTHLWAL